MEQKLKDLQTEALAKIEQAEDLKTLNEIRVAYLGKKGPITEVLRGMGQLSADERPKMGALANEVRESISQKIEAKHTSLEKEAVEKQLAAETIDITLPGRPVKSGNHHPLTRVVEEIEDFFIGMGYKIAEGPEVEKDYYNFESTKFTKRASCSRYARFFLYYGRSSSSYTYITSPSENNGKA